MLTYENIKIYSDTPKGYLNIKMYSKVRKILNIETK